MPASGRRSAPRVLPPPAIAAAALGLVASAALTWWILGGGAIGHAFAALLLTLALAAAPLVARARPAADTPVTDVALLNAAFLDGIDATTIIDRRGKPVCVSTSYRTAFGGPAAPRDLPFDGDGSVRLSEGVRRAWRGGAAEVADLRHGDAIFTALLRRAGQREDHVVLRFRRAGLPGRRDAARLIVEGGGGSRFGAAGVMMALVESDGALIAANALFRRRALGDDAADAAGRPFAPLLRTDPDGAVRLARDEGAIAPLRVIHISLGEGEGGDGGDMALFMLLDENPEAIDAGAARGAATLHLHGLLAMLPLGLALVDRDGRILFMNRAFGRAAGVTPDDIVVYPSDLVIEEDKRAVIDAIRRFASGRALPGDLAIRLKHRPDEPAALSIGNAKGLGDAVALLGLKDDSEESKLKRQVAQATKMQAVGQLAGGVAHDFNNILTAIIGHCDLVTMRHTPGDSDYDDIQQIKHYSNRAAALTRQLLAFSRQQTLRPQILQLPSVISEVSNLLGRLLGETIRLDVRHGRNLGLVRADPGQLEQVIVNLAVNARDAMPNGGVLTLQTYAVSAAEVRRMRNDILPVADYTALSVTDTGGGIPDEIIGKIFEPFFTTKEVGKGTGLGLSTVYGIVKQTDGFIFADSGFGGTRFVIYLPVHDAPGPVDPVAPVKIDGGGDVWGTGTILLVEDEAMVRAVAERALIRQGYRVLTAANGAEALEILTDGETIDLLVSDVVMPVMDGPTLVREARRRFPDLRILFISGYAEEHLRSSIDIDHVEFLAKPFSVVQLGAAARDALVSKKP